MIKKIIGGNINKDGGIAAGRGFSVHRLNDKAGVFDITFDPDTFISCPTVLTKQHSAAGSTGWGDFSHQTGDARDNTILVAVDRDHCRIATGNAAHHLDWRDFTFLAIGQEDDIINATVVAGSVANNGKYSVGQNFEVTKLQPGFYLIDLTPAFAGTPIVVATQVTGIDTNTTLNVVVIAVNNKHILIKTGGPDGNPADRDFNFIAYDSSGATTKRMQDAISGNVNKDGSIYSGHGFIANKIAAGSYSVRFDWKYCDDHAITLVTENYLNWPDFSYFGGDPLDAATVAYDNCYGGDPLDAATVADMPSKFDIRVHTGGGGGTPDDRNFGFFTIIS